MPDYQFTDPKTGQTLHVNGPEPPSAGILAQLFADAAKKAPTPATKSHPDATIGPAPADAPVTFGDLIADPHAAVQRMVAITKHGLSDPRNTIPAAIGIAAGATGLMPRSFASTRGLAAPATMPAAAAPTATPGILQAIRQNVKLDDVVDAIPGAKNAKAAYRVGKGLVTAAQQAGKATETPTVPASRSATPSAPAPASGSTAATAATPPSPKATRPTPPAATASAAPNAPAAAADALPSLDELHLTPAEITQGVKWHEQGVSPETILHRILQSRQLTARTNSETPDQAAFAIAERNRTGKWRD